MSIFAIRDDDTSFFTQPAELDLVYAPYWGEVPVSLAAVPFSVPDHRDRSLSTGYPADAELPLNENAALVEWLIAKLQSGQVEVMLHGYNHRYLKIDGRWTPEFGWKSEAQLIAEVRHGKRYLENLLNTRVQVFVPPSNTIGKAGVRAIRQEGLDVSATMGRGGDRPWTMDYPAAYLKRWGWRLFRGQAYPFPLCYGGHRELGAYALTPRADPQQLVLNLERCVRQQAPFVLATHYWEFAQCPAMHGTLKQLIQRARELKMTFAPVGRCFSASIHV